MRKLTFVLGLAGLLFATSAQAAPMSCAALSGSQIGISCTCASGTCDAPADSAAGAPTKPTSTGTATAAVRIGATVTSLDVKLCPTTTGATITAGKVDLYFYQAGEWSRIGSYTSDASPAAKSSTVSGCVMVRFDSPGKGFPILSKAPCWAQVVPNGTTLSAGGMKIEVQPSGPTGAL